MIEHANKQNDRIQVTETLVSNDGSIKYGFKTSDGRSIESMYFPFTGIIDREHIDATVLCLSSQVGCPIGCDFCATGKIGNPRNLTIEEINGQFQIVREDVKNRGMSPIDSLAMMGMGEPLLNIDNVLMFALSVADDNEIQRFSISTVGLSPKIAQLRKSGMDIKLYLSVHTPFNDERAIIIPISKTYPIEKVVDESRQFAEVNQRTVVANYILINHVNDSRRHVLGLAELLDPDHFDIQLNHWNPVHGVQLQRSDDEKLDIFRTVLENKGYVVDVQLSKGTDVSGGCGQLSSEN